MTIRNLTTISNLFLVLAVAPTLIGACESGNRGTGTMSEDDPVSNCSQWAEAMQECHDEEEAQELEDLCFESRADFEENQPECLALFEEFIACLLPVACDDDIGIQDACPELHEKECSE